MYSVRRAGDARAVGILRDRNRNGQAVILWRCAKVPPGADDRVAQVHDEAVARVDCLRGVVAGRGVVQRGHAHVAAIVEVEQQLVAALAEVDRLQDEDVHRVLDPAAGISRRVFEIGDERVVRIVGIEFAVGPAAKLFVRPHFAVGSKDPPLESGRLRPRAIDDDPRDVSLGELRRRGQGPRQEESDGGHSQRKCLHKWALEQKTAGSR